MKTVCFERIDIIEWYDGLVRGVGFTTSSSYLLTMYWWQIRPRQRKYIVIKLDDRVDAEFKLLLSQMESASDDEKTGNWEKFEQLYGAVIDAASQPIFSLESEPVVGKSQTCVISGELGLLEKLRHYDIEEVLQQPA